jgi:luciferase family oxidoreductase group 1
MIKLGLLEFGVRGKGVSPAVILEDVMNYAVQADKLGFSRFWLTEHHYLSPAWNNPEMLLPIIAGLTENIRVGVAGILLAMHSPYRVAQSFKLLSNLFPGRIDLGLANGVTSYEAARLLSNDTDLRKDFYVDFEPKLEQLVQFLRKEGGFIDREIIITPHPGEIPEIWSLRSSYRNLSDSLNLQINFSRSLFHRDNDVYSQKEELFRFREEYCRRYGAMPKINFTFAGICQKTQQKAASVQKEAELDDTKMPYNKIIGTPGLFCDKLMAIHEELKIDEFIFHNLCPRSEDRMNSLELLNDVFKLNGTHNEKTTSHQKISS